MQDRSTSGTFINTLPIPTSIISPRVLSIQSRKPNGWQKICLKISHSLGDWQYPYLSSKYRVVEHLLSGPGNDNQSLFEIF